MVEFLFGTKVRITSGFFRGCVGILTYHEPDDKGDEFYYVEGTQICADGNSHEFEAWVSKDIIQVENKG